MTAGTARSVSLLDDRGDLMARTGQFTGRVAAMRAEGFRLTRWHLAGAAALAAAGAIVVNAVALQSEKHPAPMFRAVAKAPEPVPLPPVRVEAARPAAPAQPVPVAVAKPVAEKPKAPSEPSDTLLMEIQSELAKRGHFKGEPNGRPGPTTTQAIRDFQFAQRLPVDGKPSENLLREVIASKVTMKDELLDLVKKANGDDKTTRMIADIQRALNKAGYGPLTEDGQMGPSTKTALARFESDRKLPPRGEPKGPVLKMLASASGVPISQ